MTPRIPVVDASLPRGFFYLNNEFSISGKIMYFKMEPEVV